MPSARRRAWALAALLLLLAPAAQGQLPTPTQDEPQPDLMGMNLALDPARPHDEQDLTFCGTVLNRGQGDVTRRFEVFLRIDGEDRRFSSIDPPLRAGHERRLCWDLPPLVAGEHRFTIAVDPDERIDETDRSNNVPAPVRFTVDPAPLPELVFVDAGVNPRFGKPGQPQTFFAVIENAGPGNASASFVDIEDEDGLIARLHLPAIPSGQRAFVHHGIWPDTRMPGQYTARFVIDPTDLVRERNETVRDAHVQYVIMDRPLADLAIDATRLSGKAIARHVLQLDVDVANVGEEVAPASILRLHDGERVIANTTVPTLNAGGMTTASFRFILEAGEHELRIVADADRNVLDRHRDNNEAHVPVVIDPAATPFAMPNLVAARLSAAPDDPREDEVVTITALVSNTGEKDAFDVPVAFYVDGIHQGTIIAPRIDVGRSVTLTQNWPPDGVRDVIFSFTIDPAGAVEEERKDDNDQTLRFMLHEPREPWTTPRLPSDEDDPNDSASPAPAPPADPGDDEPAPPQSTVSLAPVNIGDVSVEATSTPGGVRGNVLVTLRNPNIDPLGRMTVSFLLGGQPLREVLVEGIGPAGTRIVPSGELALLPGHHAVEVQVRMVGDPVPTASAEATYQAEAGNRVPSVGIVVLLGVVAVAAMGRRRV